MLDGYNSRLQSATCLDGQKGDNEMKGIEVSQAEIDCAKEFLRVTQKGRKIPSEQSMITLNYGKMIRLVAWYGAIRSRGVPPKSGRFTVNHSDSEGNRIHDPRNE